jgi:ATP-binding cassette subfamily B multidrug efflux pump
MSAPRDERADGNDRTGAEAAEERLAALRDAEEDAASLRTGARGFRETLGRLLAQTFEHPRLLGGAVALMLAGVGAGLVTPWILGYAVDHAIGPRDRDLLLRLTGLFLAAEAVRWAATAGYAYLFEWLGQSVMQDLRVRLFSHLQSLPVASFDRTPIGRLVTRVTNDISALSEMFSMGFVSMGANVLTVLGILGWLFALDWPLALVASTILPPLVAVSVHFSRRLQQSYRDSRTRLSAFNAYLAENILGMRVVQLFGRESLHGARLGRINDEYARAQIATVRVFAYFQPAITWFSGFAMALVIAYGGHRAASGEVPLGTLVAFFTYVVALFQPVREITDKWNVVLAGVTAAERVYGLLAWAPELDPAGAAREIPKPPPLRGEIEFENVWFAYEGERWVLRDFSLRIAAGSRVGVVGHTGAGKTTLISLLLRFYEPQRGVIRIDGRDLREYDRRELRARFGLIQQDVFLFSGSVRENAGLWREPLPAAVEPLLARFGRRADAELLERGTNLSMGERQVLGFARALAAEPSVWILDEATANVDSESEAELGRVLDQATRGHTALLIAHRLATVRDADRILVLHHGSLVEQGTHAELMRSDGLYARLYRFQQADGELAGEPPKAGGTFSDAPSHNSVD